MTPGSGRVLKDNAFLVAAVSLPLIVAAFFVLSSAIPRWMVPPPAYDLLFRVDAYNQADPRVSVEFGVRDGKVEATVRYIATNAFGQRSKLFLWEHSTMSAREIAVNLPATLREGDPPRTIVIDALAGRQVITQGKAPDGYQLENRTDRGAGIVGDLFGMRRYNSEASLVNRGRIIRIDLPAVFQNIYQSPVSSVGWLVDRGQR